MGKTESDWSAELPPSPRCAPCELCGGSAFQIVGRRERRGEPLVSVVCVTCGLISHETLPTDAELTAYYSEQYRRDYHGEFTPSPHRVLRAWRTGQILRKRLLPFLHEQDTVLEIGAGIGCTVKSLELAGYEAEGIEPHHGFQAFAEKRLRARVRRCTLAEMPTDAKFDFILLVHVIEHFNHPRRDLERIAGLLKPGGRLYVECPNAEAPHAAPGRMFHFAHVYNFTNPTLAMLAQVSGLARRAVLFPPEHPLIGQVFALSAAAKTAIDPESYHRSVAALTRYNTLTYHLRPRYLVERVQRFASQTAERVFAQQRLMRLLSRIEATSPPPTRRLRQAA